MKSTLRDKIKLQIQEAFQDGHYFADGYDGKVRGTADGRTDAILKEVEMAMPKELEKILSEEGIKWTQEGDHKDRKGFTMGFNFYRGKVLKLVREGR